MWVDCEDCQRVSSQPYPFLGESQDGDSSEEPEP